MKRESCNIRQIDVPDPDESSDGAIAVILGALAATLFWSIVAIVIVMFSHVIGG